MPVPKKRLHETIPNGMCTIAEVAAHLKLNSYVKARDVVLSGKCGPAIRHTDGRTWLVKFAGVMAYRDKCAPPAKKLRARRLNAAELRTLRKLKKGIADGEP